ncbi:cystathionine beta-lyase [Mycoemilia scoparia]|uniref:Cystathionine beta-lyase n=1 Tax=Mycoemilia scoparia TaxID=417184 RepID=A0A9W8A2U8_9FUNG|nr:cystathionine beta-lyase [Mycoemilia scoparia]
MSVNSERVFDDVNLDRPKYHPSTELVYLESTAGEGQEADTLGVRDPYHSSSVPLYQTATFKQPSADGTGEFDYTRSGNPTRSAVETHLAKIMKAERAFVVTTGMTALDVILRLVPNGGQIIAGDDLYGGSNRLLTYLTKLGHVEVENVDTTNVEAVRSKLDPVKTRLVLLETPTNPLIKIADIRAVSDLVHEKCPNAVVVVDNTMMSPYLQNCLDLGADIEYHSGTKYLSGHHDMMAGVIGVRSLDLADRIFFVINATGSGLSPFESWLLLRGLKTLAIRIERQQATAQRIAEFLENQTDIKRVLYPGLPSHPQHQIHISQASGPGGVLSFETGDIATSERIVEATKLYGISVSFGCINSLISMPCRMSHASIPAEVRKARALPEDVVRLCVGIEDPDDLINDLKSALIAAGVKVKA